MGEAPVPPMDSRGAACRRGLRAEACREFCLSVLELSGASVRAVETADGTSYWVELPDELAWHWGSRGRPCPALWLTFDERRQGLRDEDGPSSDVSGPPQQGDVMAAGQQAAPAEPVGPLSRRFWEIRALSLDLGWLGVFHQPAKRHVPALWLWMEAAADGGPLGLVPPAGPVAVWVNLAGRPAEPAAYFLSSDLHEAPGQNARPSPGVSPPPELAVCWGPAPRVRLLRKGRSSLAEALEQAALAAAQAFVERPDVWQWLASSSSDPPEAGPRLRLFLTMAALIYLDADAPWPPPPRLRPVVRARTAAAPSASIAPAAGSPGHGAVPDR